MEKKNWYAVLAGSSDNDWGTGSFCWSEAVAMSKSRGCETIAEIDGGYDEDGHESTDPSCVAEYISGEDF